MVLTACFRLLFECRYEISKILGQVGEAPPKDREQGAAEDLLCPEAGRAVAVFGERVRAFRLEQSQRHPPVSTSLRFGSNTVTRTGNACGLSLVKNLTVSPAASFPSMWSMLKSQAG